MKNHKNIICGSVFILLFAVIAGAKETKVFETVEWEFSNPSWEGNPYDVSARAVFLSENGASIETGLFYNEGNTWKLRFTPTSAGQWRFVTKSTDPQLDNLTGQVQTAANPGKDGFISNAGSKWIRTGTMRAFSPQYIMYTSPDVFANQPERIDADITEFIEGHGFNGFATGVLCSWFDINKTRSNEIESNDPNPDPRTFEAIELLLSKLTEAGAVLHIWAWGDEQRRMTPMRWGLNGKVDRRLQRYIAARLGPLPGWSMCYGFDLQEWAKEKDLRLWHEYMQQQMGWKHLFGGRSPELEQIYDGLDYSSYQKHRPDYAVYLKAIGQYPDKPTFLEDRFRVRKGVYPDKDYTFEMTRRGLWHSTMAGGAANIWGNLLNPRPDGMSHPYPNKEQIKTWSLFWRDRFDLSLTVDDKVKDGCCLRSLAKRVETDKQKDVISGSSLAIYYKEDADFLTMNLSSMQNPLQVVAVDTKKVYAEIPITGLRAEAGQDCKMPYKSDWAVAVALGK